MHGEWGQKCPLCGGGDLADPDCALCLGEGVLDESDARQKLPPVVPCPDCGHMMYYSTEARYCDHCGLLDEWPGWTP